MEKLFGAEEKIFQDLLSLRATPWECLMALDSYIDSLFTDQPKGFEINNNLLVGANVKLGKNVTVLGRAVLLEGAEVCDNAILRDGVILGKNSFVGFGIEIKHSVIMEETRIPHLNYVADSIVGARCNFGAGTITANWKGGFDNKDISVVWNGEKINTHLEKFGSIVGDDVYFGCNCVLNPGTVVGKNTHIYPQALIGGEIPANVIVKNHSNLEIVKKV